MIRITLYRITLEKDSLRPHVPHNRAPGEDNVTPRICLSESPRQCVNAMPGAGKTMASLLHSAKVLNIPPILWLYQFEFAENTAELISPEALVADGLVPDAEGNREWWLMRAPEQREIVLSERLQLLSVECKDVIDTNGKPLRLATSVLAEKAEQELIGTDTLKENLIAQAPWIAQFSPCQIAEVYAESR